MDGMGWRCGRGMEMVGWMWDWVDGMAVWEGGWGGWGGCGESGVWGRVVRVGVMAYAMELYMI